MRRFQVAMIAALCAGAGAAIAASSTDSPKTPPLYGEIQRGKYLVDAADCKPCHTESSGKPYAGGRGVPTPFGTIYAPNITPDKETGIGNWSQEQFWNAMHEGTAADGSRLYPAMPYPWYTRFTKDDVLAIKAYLDTIPAVRSETKKPDLPFPMSWRGSMAAWDRLYFKPGTYQGDPGKSPEWNRGAYLVQGAGHCGACHSPKNVLGAVKQDRRFEGGKAEGWFAVDLTEDGAGLGTWSVNEIVEYLKTGANHRARAIGPMSEVVTESTSRLSEADLHAMAVYLKSLQGPRNGERHEAKAPSQEVVSKGRLVYLDQCAGCHMENGSGVPGVFPDLRQNTALRSDNPESVVRLVLKGARSAKTKPKPEGFAMPAFGGKLADEQVAEVLSYVRSTFGANSSAITSDKVADIRKQIAKQTFSRND